MQEHIQKFMQNKREYSNAWFCSQIFHSQVASKQAKCRQTQNSQTAEYTRRIIQKCLILPEGSRAVEIVDFTLRLQT